jgi:HSP20 family protein
MEVQMKTLAKNETKERTPVSGEVIRFPALFDEMERWAEDMFARGWMRPFRFGERALAEGYPRVDVLDRDNEVFVRAALPGFRKEDIDISVSDNLLTIRGKTEHEKEEKDEHYFHREIGRSDMLRTVSLPVAVIEDKAEASFKDGILELHLPKVEKAKPRRIEIH